jgi:D-3-phosphoglycerate dehydrogenase
MFRILVCDPISEQGIDMLRQHPNVQVDVKLKQTEDVICAMAANYHALIVRSETKITDKILEKATNLKVVGRAGVGVDNINVEAATQRGVVVVNTPDGNTISACEHTMALLLAMARNVPQAQQSLKEGRWDRSKYMGVELRGKKIGILGFGKIGAEVSVRCRAFGMDILAYDPYITEERAQQFHVRLCTKEEIFKEADYITVHMPKTAETKDMIAKQEFELMKPTARVLNVARGGIINEQDLYEALSQSKIAGAAIDVFEKEPQTDSPLFKLPQVVATPHLGASTEEAQVQVAQDVAEEIIRVLNGELVHNAANIPFMKPEMAKKMEPFMALAEKLGKVSNYIAEGPIQKVEIKYTGDVPKQEELRPLTNTLMKALLRPALGYAVNYVNAPVVAKERGIKITVTQENQSQDYVNQMTVTIRDQKGKTHRIGGSVFQNGEIHIIQIDEFNLDIRPEGHLLLAPHKNQPKVVGPVGMILGDAGVNISGMQVSRENNEGFSLMVLTLDSMVPEHILKELEQIPAIHKAIYVEL